MVTKAAEKEQAAKVAALKAKINKDIGFEGVYLGSEIQFDELPRISTGSISFDYALGGGLPVNNWTEIIGLESSGKTATVLKTIAHNQAIDPMFTVHWVAAEEYVKPWAAKLGVDNSRMIIHDTNIMEEAYEGTLSALESRAVDMVVIDSYPALVSVSEDEKAMEDMQVAMGARVTGKWTRKARKATHRSQTEADRPVTGVLINQWRDTIQMYGDPRTTPGGKAKNFFCFIRVDITRVDYIEKPRGNKVGQAIKMMVVKNKTARPRQSGEVDFYFHDAGIFRAGDYDTTKEYAAVGMATGAIPLRGSVYDLPDGSIAKGRNAVFEALEDNPEMQQLVREAVLLTLSEPAHDADDVVEVDGKQYEKHTGEALPPAKPAKKAAAKKTAAKKAAPRKAAAKKAAAKKSPGKIVRKRRGTT